MSASESSVFGTRLKEARLHAGLSQRKLGIEAGLDPSVASTRINRYELGVHEVDYPFAIRLAKVLRVPVAYFYADDGDLSRLILMFGGISKKKREELIAFANFLQTGNPEEQVDNRSRG
ncbi:helix-turn-helix domain-containing protein [Paraburkholderia sp. BCC1885]|uniref:helix-turn-helix domain-containing protein n=1 Tax=Paraburkholderia sp. BCC1885 TaxID=2562669 RepID=UPI0011826771|nr:helix-turn-helix transcriptional regulator [Paraburkholderia sp. BCC1885]